MNSLVLRHVRPVRFRCRGELSLARARGGHDAPSPGPAAGRGTATSGVAAPAAGEPVDVRIDDGVVTRIGRDLDSRGARVLDGGGGHLIPGLWDAHVHLDQTAAGCFRIDTTAARCAEDVLALVAERLRAPGEGPALVQACGHRLSAWPRIPTVAELDAVTGRVPAVLASGDFHSGWLNSAALRLLGRPGATEAQPGAPVREEEWFELVNRLDEIPGTRELRERGYHRVLSEAVTRGVTGIVDMSWNTPAHWPRLLERVNAGADRPAPLPRIRSAVYAERLEWSIASGLRTGDAVPGSPRAPDGSALITRGPLKIITDGSLGTMTALVSDPYPDELGCAHPYGVANVDRDALVALLTRARATGYEVAVHAIGDRAIEAAAAAFAATGARGRIEHAQLMPAGSFTDPASAFARLVELGVELSVQPAHLLDDWPMVDRIWPGRKERAYAFAQMIGGRARLALGSDAPVARLDPWLAMSTAVGRVMPDGRIWSPSQRLTAEEALASSVDGCSPVAVGSRADLALLANNPVELDADGLAGVQALATIVGGALVHLG